MNVFCDTNVLVAAFCESHPNHDAARPIVERIRSGKDKGFVALHSLAEVYAVLTRLPGNFRVDAANAWRVISENVLKDFTIVSLTPKEYACALEDAANSGIEGGMTYDALLVAAARKSRAERIFTGNVRHFWMIADEEMRARIVAAY
jgi:predicted nucleic acid-binding protein